MIETLNSIVRKVILPEYPWIKDFDWTYVHFGGFKYYSLEVTVDNDFYMYRTDTTEIYNKLFEDTKMLFRMTSHEENEFFDDVTITPED